MKTVFVLLSSLLLPSVAFAQESTDVIYGKASTDYLLKDVGVPASLEPVLQGGATRTWGKVSVDVFGSVGSEGGTANEIDLSIFYDDKIGPVVYQLALQYYDVNVDDSLFESWDDFIVVYADVSYPMQFGNLTVAPLARMTQMQAVDELQSSTLLAPGVRASYQFSKDWSAKAEWREPFNLSQDYRTTRLDLTVSWQVTKEFALTFGGEYFKRHDTRNDESALSVGFVITPE